MDFIEIAKKRYSVRSYQDKKVEEGKANKNEPKGLGREMMLRLANHSTSL